MSANVVTFIAVGVYKVVSGGFSGIWRLRFFFMSLSGKGLRRLMLMLCSLSGHNRFFFECINAIIMFALEGAVMRKSPTILVVILLVATTGAFAGQLNKNMVAGDANWVVHGDIEKFNETKIAKLVRDELTTAGGDQNLEFFKSIFSFHPLDDLKSVTIYGQGQDKSKAVAVIRGDFDKGVLMNLLKQNSAYGEQKHGDHDIARWVDDKSGEKQYGSFHGKDLIVIGTSQDTVAKTLDVLDGKRKNARQKGLFKILKKSSNDAFLVAAASGVGKIAQNWEKAMMLKNTERSCLTVGESEGNVSIDLSLVATSSQKAEELAQLLQGMIAFLNLAGQEQPQIAQLASAIKVDTRRSTVRVHFEYDVDKISEFVKAEWKKKQSQQAEQTQKQDAQGK